MDNCTEAYVGDGRNEPYPARCPWYRGNVALAKWYFWGVVYWLKGLAK